MREPVVNADGRNSVSEKSIVDDGEMMLAEMAGISARLPSQLGLQRRNGGAKVDVERCSIDYDCGHRLHASRFSSRNAIGVFAEMHKLHIVAGGIQGISNLTLGFDTYRAAGMVESSRCFHS